MKKVCFTVALQGEVEIRDGESHEQDIRIEVEKSGPSSQALEGIGINQTLFDVGDGTIFVLQLVGVCMYLTHSGIEYMTKMRHC